RPRDESRPRGLPRLSRRSRDAGACRRGRRGRLTRRRELDPDDLLQRQNDRGRPRSRLLRLRVHHRTPRRARPRRRRELRGAEGGDTMELSEDLKYRLSYLTLRLAFDRKLSGGDAKACPGMLAFLDLLAG